MKVLSIIQTILISLILLFFTLMLVIIILYGGYRIGIFGAILYDRPEFSHFSSLQLNIINILTSLLFSLGILLPYILLFIPNINLSKKLRLTCYSLLIPILLLLIKIFIYPNPDNFSQTSYRNYTLRTYQFGKKTEIWISEKPFTEYKYPARIRWRKITEKELNEGLIK